MKLLSCLSLCVLLYSEIFASPTFEAKAKSVDIDTLPDEELLISSEEWLPVEENEDSYRKLVQHLDEETAGAEVNGPPDHSRLKRYASSDDDDDDDDDSSDDDSKIQKYDRHTKRRSSYNSSGKRRHYSKSNSKYKRPRRRNLRSHNTTVVMPTGISVTIRVPNMSNNTCGTPATLINLSPTGKMAKREYDIVSAQMRGSIDPALSIKFNILKIEKIVNGCLWDKYQKRQRVVKEESKVINERMLFHGSANMRPVMDNGFDERYARNGFFGFGIYFSPRSSKSNGYTIGGPGERQMLLCRVTEGNIYKAPGSNSFPHPPPGYHSVEGFPIAGTNPPLYNEVIIYRGEQAYPEFLITYKQV